MTWVCSTHHVLCIKHLLSQLWHREGAVLLGATGCEWCKANHEKVQAREGDEINSELTEISIELTRKPKASSHTTHGSAHEVVEVTVCGCCQLQGPEANVVQCLIVQKHAFIGVLDKLMEGQHCVVRFDDSVR